MRRPLLTLVCRGTRCHAKGRPQPAGRFKVARARGLRFAKTCSRCRNVQRSRSEKHRHTRKREAILARDMKRGTLAARVSELTRQLRTERAARVALAREVEVLKGHLGMEVLP